jgi:hypothetical protein
LHTASLGQTVMTRPVGYGNEPDWHDA